MTIPARPPVIAPVIAVDLGGTNLRLGAVASSGRILKKDCIRLPPGSDPIGIVRDEVNALRRFGLKRGWRFLGLGAAVPGVIDAARGVVTESPNYPSWKNLPLKGILHGYFRIPIILENDANAYAYGEGWKGAGRSYKTFIVLTLGTGVGGGLVLGGRLWRGSDGMGGEIGHITVDPDGPPCHCGSRGCLEVFASATGITRMIREALAQGVKSSLRACLSAGDQAPAAHDVFAEAKKGDPLALRTFEIVGKFLGVALAGLINLLNPEAIILGGGVAAASRFFLRVMNDEIALRAYDAPRKRVRILRSALDDDAGLLGAARLCFDTIKKSRPPSVGRPGYLSA